MRRMNKRSFTLIELVMVAIILSIIGLIAVFPLVRFFQLWVFSTHKMELLWGSRTAMQELTKNIRMVRSRADITVANDTQLIFTNSSGAQVNYQYSAGKLYKNGVQFIDRINSFDFNYYYFDPDTDQYVILTSLALAPLGRNAFVEIDMTFSSEDETVSSKSKIECRNL